MKVTLFVFVHQILLILDEFSNQLLTRLHYNDPVISVLKHGTSPIIDWSSLHKVDIDIFKEILLQFP